MNENLSILLQAIAMRDMPTARHYARLFCIESEQTMPVELVQWLSPRLEDSAGVEIPFEIATLIIYEDTQKTFNPRRYWVSPREKKLLDDIINLNRGLSILRDAEIPFLNATLLYGQSGVGKTQFGRFLAYSLGLPYISVNLSNLPTAELGGTSHNLNAIFDFVDRTPCLLMLDELDAIGANRGGYARGGSGDEMTRTTITLMQCLDVVRRDIVICAATNRVDMLDAAVLRRFSVIHELKSFLPEEMVSMADLYLQDVKETGKLEITWNTDEIRRECQLGRAQAEIINLCNRAVVRAVMTDNVVRFSDEAVLASKSWY